MDLKGTIQCCLHEIVHKHKAQMKKILADARKRPHVITSFSTTPICETPQGEKLTLDDLEDIYLRQNNIARKYPLQAYLKEEI